MAKKNDAPYGGGLGGRALSAEEEAEAMKKSGERRAKENADRSAKALKTAEDKAMRGPQENK